MSDWNIDLDSVPERDNIDPVPAGQYCCEIIEANVVEPKSRNGLMLKLTLQIVDGAYANRKIWDNVNFKHTNQTAQMIGQQIIKSIAGACGFQGALDNDRLLELYSIPFMVKVIVEQKEQYDSKNVVKKYFPMSGEKIAAPVRAASSPAPQAPPVVASVAARQTGRGAPAFMDRR